MINFKGRRFEQAIILACARWRLACPPGYRNLEETTAERGVAVGHSSICRRGQKFAPQLEAALR